MDSEKGENSVCVNTEGNFGGHNMISYFEEIVLPSVNIPKKGSYNTKEVGLMFNRSRWTIDKWRKSEKLSFVENAGLPRIYHEELKRFFSKYDQEDFS